MDVAVGAELGRGAGRRPGDGAGGPAPAGHAGAGAHDLRAGVHVLPAADLRALPEPVVRRVAARPARCTSARRTASSSSTRTRCRGWRYCVSGCPYKKVYFNHRTGKAEKCTLCYPRIEVGQPTICSETCVGRIRYLGLVLYDADRVEAAASVPDERDLLAAQRDVFLDPEDPEVPRGGARRRDPRATGSTPRGARRSTTSRCAGASRCRCTRSSARCRWSGTCRRCRRSSSTLEIDGYEADPDDVFGAIDNLRIPLEYLANLLTAGDVDVIRAVLHRLAAMRAYMRKREVLGETDDALPERVGLTGAELERMYRLLAIADYEDRYVIPQAHAELGRAADAGAGRLRAGLRGRPGQLRRRRAAPDTSSPYVPRRRGFHLLDILKRAALRGVAAPRARAVGAALLLLRYPDERVAGAPRRSSRRGRGAAGGPVRDALERFLAGWTGDRARDYVETFDLRRRASLQPDLLRARRHARARHGAAAAEEALPRRRAAAGRAASCPTTWRSCSRSPRSRRPATARRCWPSTGRRSSCCGSRCTTSRARTRTCSTPSRAACRR